MWEYTERAGKALDALSPALPNAFEVGYMANPNPRPIPLLTPQEISRFWSHVDRSGGTDACWPWMGDRNIQGYGKLKYRRNGSWLNFKSHRVAYWLSTGDDPGPLSTCHSCDTPLCVNPKHLFAATQRENLLDMVRKGRALTGDRNRMHTDSDVRAKISGVFNRMHTDPSLRLKISGSLNVQSKLSDPQVLEIRARYAGGERQPKLAKEFGVGQDQISRIVNRKRWTHLP
jgi:hypothetical protein